MRILPTAFSLEHIPKALAPSGTLRSAPRDFRVYVRETLPAERCCPDVKLCLILICLCSQGLDDESQERGELLGTYTYDEDGEALQTYPVTVSTAAQRVSSDLVSTPILSDLITGGQL